MRERNPLLQAVRVGAVALAAAVLAATASADTPVSAGWFINYAGVLFDAGNQALNGTVEVTFRAYANAQAPFDPPPDTPLWTSAAFSATAFDGAFTVRLGPLPEDLFAGRDEVFVGVTVGSGTELVPRVRLGGALLAARARAADAVTGKSHCDCLKISIGASGLTACAEGRVVGGLFNECSGGGSECVSAMNCCRICE